MRGVSYLVKDLAGWSTEIQGDGTIVTTTPTGHRHTSRPPRPVRSAPWQPTTLTTLERRLAVLTDLQWPGAG